MREQKSKVALAIVPTRQWHTNREGWANIDYAAYDGSRNLQNGPAARPIGLKPIDDA